MYIYVMATSFFSIYVMATSFFYIYIDIYIGIYTDMQKAADAADICAIFFSAGANFWAILGHFWAISAILGHFWANLGNFGSFLGYFG